MATQVKIFDADFSESINKLKADLKETRKLFEAATPNTKEFQSYSSEIKRLDGTIKALNGVTKEQVNALGGINQAAKFATGSYGELKQKIEQQKKALLELNVESEDFAKTQEELITLQNQRIEIEKKIPSLFKERIKGAIDESNSLKQLKIDLIEAKNAALNGDGKAAQKVAELQDKIDDLKDSTKSLQGSGVERLNTSINLLTEGFANFDSDKVKTGFKGIGAAMSAIPIVLIIEGIKALIDNFDAVVSFVKELIGVIDDGAKKVAELTKEIELQELANIKLISSLENEIAIMEAQEVAGDKIIESKKKLAAVQIEESKKQIELNKSKIAQIQNEESSQKSLLNTTLFVLGFQTQAYENSLKDEQDRAKRILELDKEIAKEEAEIEKENTLIQIEKIKFQKEEEKKKVDAAEKAKKEKVDAAEKAKKEKDERLKFLKDEQDSFISATLLRWEIEEENEKKRIESLKRIDKANEDAWKKEVEALDAAYQQEQIDLITRAENEIFRITKHGGDILEAKLALLEAEMNYEIEFTAKSEEEKERIRNEYRELNKQATLQQAQDDLKLASDLTNALIATNDIYFTFKRENLKKGSEEDREAAKKQFEINKGLALTMSIINTAAAIVASVANNVLPYPASLVAPISIGAIGTAQTAVIATKKFQYFEGGYTGVGDPTHESYSIGNKQFHKDEYVIPSRVLNTEKGSLIASYAEGLRKGTANNFKHIGGFFDGGFTSRSASSEPIANAQFQTSIMEVVTSMPTPVVRVTDINNVNASVSKAINVSSI